MRKIFAHKVLSDEEAAKLAGTKLDDTSYDAARLITREDADVFDAETGNLLIRFRTQVLPHAHCARAFAALRSAATKTDNRGMAGGIIPELGKTRFRPVRKSDGKVSKQNQAVTVNSGIVGYYDGHNNPRIPYCRQTAWTMKNPEKFAEALPLIQFISGLFELLASDRHQAQQEIANKTAPDWVIPETVFTTVTVNKNFQTAVHQDAGDYAPGFGVMTAFRAGEYYGGILVFPQYRVAVDMRNTDLLLADVHQWHGNTAMQTVDPARPFERVSLVLYFREKIADCLPIADEIERARTKKQVYLDY